MRLKAILSGFRLTVVAAVLVCALGMAPAGAKPAQKIYVLNLGKLHLRLTPGVMGLAVIFILLILLAVAVLLAIVARRRARQSRAAQQGLGDQLERLRLLDQITRAIGERQDLRSVFQVAIRSLEDSLPIDFGCVCLYEPVAEVLTVSCVGVRSEALAMELALTEQGHIAVAQNGLARGINGKLVHEPAISHAGDAFPQRLARGGMRSFVAAPLEVESGMFGVLIAPRKQPNTFNSGDCEFFPQLSGHGRLAAPPPQSSPALPQA